MLQQLEMQEVKIILSISFIAAKNAIKFGANSITIHLREDRRHINDKDLKIISSLKKFL